MMSTVHTMDGYYPGKNIFSRDMILQVKEVANWEFIKEWKVHTVHQSNAQGRGKQLQHPYWVGDKVLIGNKEYLRDNFLIPTQGNFKVLEVFGNGTLKFENRDTQKQSSLSDSKHTSLTERIPIATHIDNFVTYQSGKIRRMESKDRNGLKKTKRAGPNFKIWINKKLKFCWGDAAKNTAKTTPKRY